MNPFILDIETGPRPDAEAWLPPVEAPSNYKDQAKIDAYVAEKKAVALERAALSAETARILCVGILPHGKSPVFVGNDGEAELLRATWADLEKRGANDVFVTFNGSRFDWPMLVRRSYVLGVTIPSWMPRDGRWKPRQHVDLMEWWQCGDRTESVSLDRFARLCGLPGKTDTGARFHVMWQENRDTALAYLRKDLELTRDLFFRVAGGMEAEPVAETPRVQTSKEDLLDTIKGVLNSTEDIQIRIAAIREVFGCPWSEVLTMDADALRSRLMALRAFPGLTDTAPPPKPTEPDEIPMTSTAPSAPPKPQPERKVEQPEAEAAPTGAEPGIAEAFASEIRKALGSEENVRLAIGWMVRNKWITEPQATTADPFLFVPQAKAEKALGAIPRFLTAIGAKA